MDHVVSAVRESPYGERRNTALDAPHRVLPSPIRYGRGAKRVARILIMQGNRRT